MSDSGANFFFLWTFLVGNKLVNAEEEFIFWRGQNVEWQRRKPKNDKSRFYMSSLT